MAKSEFEELDVALYHLKRVRPYYWIAAILFWSGAGLTMKYYLAQTGTEPSWIPGILMLVGTVIYFVARHLND